MKLFIPYYLIFLTMVYTYLGHCFGFEFDQNNFAVRFSPYCKQREIDGEFPDLDSYTREEIETMMELISTKFSMVVTVDAGGRSNLYLHNLTYYLQSYAIIYAGETAAKINRRHGSKALRVLIGINLSTSNATFETDIMLAFETVEKAHDIFPGTVIGMAFDRQDTEPLAGRILEYMRKYRGKATELGIKMGAGLHCGHFVSPDNSSLFRIQREILMHADFVFCDSLPSDQLAELDPAFCIAYLGNNFLSLRKTLQSINSQVEVMGRTAWTSSGVETWETADKLREYWEAASKWSGENNMTIIMSEAFDNPRNSPRKYRHFGWWRLTENSKAYTVSGYIEKAQEESLTLTTTSAAPIPTTVSSTSPSTTTTTTTTTTEEPTSQPVETTTEITAETTIIEEVIVKVEISTVGTGFSAIDGTPTASEAETRITGPTVGTTSTEHETTTEVVPPTSTEDNEEKKVGITTERPISPFTTPSPTIIREVNSESNKPLGIAELVGIGVGSVVAILLTIAVLVVAFRCTRPQQPTTLSINQFSDFFFGSSVPNHYTAVDAALNNPYDTSYEISRENIKIENGKLLGSGQFGCVFEAKIKYKEGDLSVALKMTKRDAPKSAMDGLLSEIKILTYLGEHPNIVGMKGAYTAELNKGIAYLATELCILGSLEGYLRKMPTSTGKKDSYANTLTETILSRDGNLTYRDMVRWSIDIASGMEYLGTKHIVHADLATRNVLLTKERTAKITDFGLSRRMYNYQNYVKTKQEPLPWRWMAIESLKRCEFSAESDVWSYGVTLWEIFSMGDIPYPGLEWTLDFVNRLVNGLRLECPTLASEEIFQIMSCCWHIGPQDRPSFSMLLEQMKYILDNLPAFR